MFPANVVTLEKPGVPAPDAASPVALPSAEPQSLLLQLTPQTLTASPGFNCSASGR
jgi:hypothetical protein